MYTEMSNTGSFKHTQPTAFRYFVISKFNLYFNVKTDEILSAPSPTPYLSPAVLPIAFNTRKPFSWGPTAHLRIDVWGPPLPSTWWPPYPLPHGLIQTCSYQHPPPHFTVDRQTWRKHYLPANYVCARSKLLQIATKSSIPALVLLTS